MLILIIDEILPLSFLGPTPTARYGHTAVDGNGLMYIFGGYDNNGLARNDLSVFKPETGTWTRITPSSTVVPDPRFSHTAYFLPSSLTRPKGALIIFGGRLANGHCCDDTWLYDLSTNEWTEISQSSGPRPPARYAAAGFMYGGYAYVQGGYDKKQRGVLNDVWALDIAGLRWKRIHFKGKVKPEARSDGHQI